MRFKLLVAIALSSLFTASIGFAAPAVQLADDATSMQSMPSDSPTAGSNVGADTSTGTGDMSGTTNLDSNDDMSADTATGDDDY